MKEEEAEAEARRQQVLVHPLDFRPLGAWLF